MAKKKIRKCLNCKKILTGHDSNSLRCHKCANILNGQKRQIHFYCMDCNKKVSWRSKRCQKCSGIKRRGKNYPKCLICGKELKNYHNKRCKECYRLTQKNKIISIKHRKQISKGNKGRNNGQYKKGEYVKGRKCEICNKKLSTGKKAKRCHKHANRKLVKTRSNIVKHHIYLKENSDEIMKISNSKHAQLHKRVYDFLYHKYGKKGVDNYIKWFDKKYGLIK